MKKYICTETGQRYLIGVRKSGIVDITERHDDKDDVVYMWDCIPTTLKEVDSFNLR